MYKTNIFAIAKEEFFLVLDVYMYFYKGLKNVILVTIIMDRLKALVAKFNRITWTNYGMAIYRESRKYRDTLESMVAAYEYRYEKGPDKFVEKEENVDTVLFDRFQETRRREAFLESLKFYRTW